MISYLNFYTGNIPKRLENLINRPSFYVLMAILIAATGSPLESVAQDSSEESAGNEASITVSVGAEIVSSIEMVTIRNIRFGKVQPSQQLLRIHPITNNKTGKMKIIGQPNSTIRINYQQNQTLQQLEGNYAVDFDYRLAGNSTDNQQTADIIDFNNFEAQLNQDGEYFIWVGGNVRLAELQPGNYQGDFTVEVEHL
jgi:hypothetical protein